MTTPVTDITRVVWDLPCMQAALIDFLLTHHTEKLRHPKIQQVSIRRYFQETDLVSVDIAPPGWLASYCIQFQGKELVEFMATYEAKAYRPPTEEEIRLREAHPDYDLERLFEPREV